MLFKKQSSKNFIKCGILGGFLEVVYILLLILTVQVLQKYAPQLVGQDILGSMLFLIVFVFSVAISAVLVLGYPVYLVFIEKKMREAVKTVGMTLLTLVVFGILVFMLMMSLG